VGAAALCRHRVIVDGELEGGSKLARGYDRIFESLRRDFE
jgi:hypothetical protein